MTIEEIRDRMSAKQNHIEKGIKGIFDRLEDVKGIGRKQS